MWTPFCFGRSSTEGCPGSGQRQTTIAWASQTALRDIIGKTMLADTHRAESIDADLQVIIDKRTEPWGVSVLSVEYATFFPLRWKTPCPCRPGRRERQAGSSWVIQNGRCREVRKAAHLCRQSTTLHLRAMNMLYED